MYRQRRKFGIDTIIFILLNANIWLRSLQVSAGRPRRPFSFTRAVDQDIQGTAMTTTQRLGDFYVDCSEAGPGYEKMTPRIIERLSIPPGCGLVFGKDAYFKCAKTVCPCQDKLCGDTCVPVKPGGGRGPFKCENKPTTGGTFANCAPASSVKCTTTTGRPTTRRTPFMRPTTTTVADIQGVVMPVDCSKVGRDFEYMTENEIKFKEKKLPLGCSLISGRDNLVNCRKVVCPCQGKECGAACFPATLSNAGTGSFKWGSFKCHKGFGCEPAASVQCPNRVVTTTTTTTSNLRSTGRDPKRQTMKGGVLITTKISTNTGSSKTTVATTAGTDVTSTGSGKTTVATTAGTDVTTAETKTAAVTKASVSSATQGAKIDDTVDEKTAPPREAPVAAVAAEDQGCAKEMSLVVAVLLHVSLFFSQ